MLNSIKSKLGIIVDSFSARPAVHLAAKHGIGLAPLQVIINDVSLRDGVDLVIGRDADREKLLNAGFSKTSQPSPATIEDLFKLFSEKFEEVIYIPINKGLSSTFSTANAIANDFKKVRVVDNRLSGQGIIDAAYMAMEMSNAGSSIDDVISKIKEMSKKGVSYILPKSVKGLVASGRVSGVKKFILEKGKLIPRLNLIDTGFKVAGLARSFSKSVSGAVEKIITGIGGSGNIKNYHFSIQHSGHQESIDVGTKYLNQAGVTEIEYELTATAVVAHTQEAIGIIAWPKINTLVENSTYESTRVQDDVQYTNLEQYTSDDEFINKLIDIHKK